LKETTPCNTEPPPDTTESTLPPCGITCQEGLQLDPVNCDCIPAPSLTPPPTTNCPLACPEGFELDAYSCICNQIYTSPTPPPQCIEKDCERGYVFFDEPVCDCMLACDYIRECPPGEKWDFIECGCVSDHKFGESKSNIQL
jgi:hypothetical protein